MLDFIGTQNALHIRTLDFSIQQYLFVLQVVLGERPEIAYANIYDQGEFKRNVPSENEEEYLAKFKRDASIMLEQQECVHLRDFLESEYKSDIQDKASTLEDYKFTGAEVQRLLNNLLHDRTQELSEASVRDILALIKSMYDSGALESGDSFSKHFISIPKKFDCLCSNCNRELYLVEGVDNRCPSCGAIYYWKDNRFYPQPPKL